MVKRATKTCNLVLVIECLNELNRDVARFTTHKSNFLATYQVVDCAKAIIVGRE